MRAVRQRFAGPVDFYEIWKVRVKWGETTPDVPVSTWRPFALDMLERHIDTLQPLEGHTCLVDDQNAISAAQTPEQIAAELEEAGYDPADEVTPENDQP